MAHPWVVLLRGINVGGKNVIPMAALREAFEDLRYAEVETYIQSGNVILSSRRAKSASAVTTIEKALSERFEYGARVVVRELGEMRRIVNDIPEDWDAEDRSVRHNVLFLTDHLTPEAIVGDLTVDPALEAFSVGPHAIYWSAPMATITRTKMLKLSRSPLYAEVTIRNPRVTRTLLERMQRHA